MKKAPRRELISFVLEQVAGIEPVYLPWQGNVLPLNYTCTSLSGFAIILIVATKRK